MPKDYYPTGEAAELLGVSNDTLRRWDRSGHVEVERDNRGHRMISAREIERLRGDPMRPVNSARNRLTGTVTEIRLDGLLAQVEIVVTSPARVVAIVTRDAVEELDLREGAAITAIVNASEVMIVS
jgi:molybdopterin-binding protein